MPLDDYRAKRNFDISPEPRGGKTPRPRKRRARFFCVQKHLATQLHYDLRLEHDNVLLSWAVPRGPSLDPHTKRLAMQVEDHPLEYGDFEGIIPDGYGAGVVLLWDRGTWEPEVEDVDAALRRGDIKMRLDGYKLKGSWALVRTKGGPGRQRDEGDPTRSWLLIKHRDDWSSGQLDITTFAPLSVKSEGDFADILEQQLPAVWTSNPGAQSAGSLASLAKIVKKVEQYQKQASGVGPRASDQAQGHARSPKPEARSPKPKA